MGRETRLRAAVVALSALGLALAGTVTAGAQLLPPFGQQQTTTTTTAPPVPGVTLVPSPSPAPPPTDPPPPTSDTTPPPAGEPTPGPGPEPGTDPGPMPEDPGEGEGGVGGAVPPEAQAIINSIARTAANDNDALLEGVAALEGAGVAHDEAVRAVFGRFPVQGPASWVDDWYYPRWTGSTFRFHLGLDMFAPYGTPVAAPADGTCLITTNPLGGLTVRVVEPDGTFWYLAHLSGIAEGVLNGSPCSLGQVVGYVGDSGNARGGTPHLHFAVHPGGGQPVPPKPFVDAWVAEGAARVVDLLSVVAAAPQPAAVVASDLTRRLANGVTAGPDTSGPPRSELLWASAASPNGGAVAVADAAAASINELVDWERRGAQSRSLDLAWSQSVDRAWQLVAPLVNPTLRKATEQRRAR